MGTTHRLFLGDENTIQDSVGIPEPEQRLGQYEVVVPIFKQGREWQPGEIITLSEVTALRFIKNNEIKEINND